MTSLSKVRSFFFEFSQNIKKTGLTSEEFVYKLMKEKQIAVVPGINYGEAGEGFIRISYVTTEEKINYLLESLNDFIQKL